VLTFLADLAKQRNLVITNTRRGALQFFKAVITGNPVAQLEQGASPVLSVTPFFSPQEYYSHITGIEPVIVGLEGSQFTVKNPFPSGVMRPFTFTAPDTEDSNIKSAVDAKMSRMFGNMISYSVQLNTWRDPSGRLWEPNTTINLQAPGAMVYGNYEFIIRSVQFEQNRESEQAVLSLVIPGSFSGQIPESLPWG